MGRRRLGHERLLRVSRIWGEALRLEVIQGRCWRPHPALSRPRERLRPGLGDLADAILEDVPGVFAVFAAPLLVEAGGAELVAERRGLDVVEGQALGLQAAADVDVELGKVGALVHGALVHLAGDDLLQVLGELFEGALVGEEPVTVPHVVGHAAVLLDFVEFGGVDDAEGVFLAVDDVGLQRGVDFAQVDAGGAGAEGGEHAGPEGADGDAQLGALEVVGGDDRVGAGGDLAEAVVPDLVEGVDAALFDLGADEATEFAVHGGPDLVVILEGEADAVDGGRRNQGGQDEARQGEELDGPGAELAEGVGVGAELAVGEDLDFEPAAGRSLDPLGGLAGAEAEGVGRGRVAREFVAELGGAGGADGEERQCCDALRESAAADDRHGGVSRVVRCRSGSGFAGGRKVSRRGGANRGTGSPLTGRGHGSVRDVGSAGREDAEGGGRAEGWGQAGWRGGDAESGRGGAGGGRPGAGDQRGLRLGARARSRNARGATGGFGLAGPVMGWVGPGLAPASGRGRPGARGDRCRGVGRFADRDPGPGRPGRSRGGRRGGEPGRGRCRVRCTGWRGFRPWARAGRGRLRGAVGCGR